MCSKAIAKSILIVTNFILFVAGGVLLGFGIAGLVNPEALQKFISQIPNVNSFKSAVDIPSLITDNAKFMIVVGSIIFFFSFMGCAGAMCEVKWMLFLYWISIVILIILEVALIIFAAVKPGMLRDETTKIMKDKWKNYSPEKIYTNGTFKLPTDAVSLSWVAIQFKLGCCGVDNYKDYKNLVWDNTYEINGKEIKAVVPPSCCITEDKDISSAESSEAYKNRLPGCLNGDFKDINPLGCYEAVENVIKQSYKVAIIVCSVIILVELLAIACAVYLWRSNERKL